MSTKIIYNGNEIANFESGSKALKCKDKNMVTDVIVSTDKVFTPTGNIELSQQTGTDVTNYATASVRSGSVTINTPTVSSSGLITASASVGTTGWIGSAPSSKTKQLTTQAAKTVTPSSSSQTAVSSGVYTTGAVTVAAVPTETKTVDLAMSSGNQTISATSGKFMTSVTVNKPSTLLPENIKKDVNIGGVVGTFEGGGGQALGGEYNLVSTLNSDGTQNLAAVSAEAIPVYDGSVV